MTSLKRMLITAGEPAGIGPDVVLTALLQAHDADILVVGDPDLLAQRAKQLGLSVTLTLADLNDERRLHQPGHVRVLPVTLAAPVTPGTLNVANAAYVIETLNTAAKACLTQAADAVVTAPVHKGIINDAGLPFTGHTEYFAQLAGVPRTLMLFVCDAFKVALATTHLPLSAVPAAITENTVMEAMVLLNTGLTRWFKINDPCLLVCGLNPHAGENGHLGREEIDVIAPTLAKATAQGLRVMGPLSADTAFTPTALKNGDAVLAMYHDQALPLVKFASFGHAVNVTLGLPFLRTSVDHGVALDIAGSGQANAGSLLAALALALVHA